MKTTLLNVLPLVGWIVVATPVSGQICAGYASLSDYPFQIGAGAAFNSNAAAFGGSFTGGKDFSGTVGVGMTTYEDLDGSSVDLGFSAVYDAPTSQRRTLFICPVAGVSLGLGPNDIGGSGIDLSSFGFSLGFSIGGFATKSDQLAVLPTASIRVAYSKATLDDNAGNSVSDDDTYGVITLGLGLVLNKVFTIQPAVAVPFGLGDSNPTFGISLAINLGNRGTGLGRN